MSFLLTRHTCEGDSLSQNDGNDWRNVSNHVDEEVHAGDGDEVLEARVASDGDRRAIADADQAAQLGISGETRTSLENSGISD